MNSTRSNEGTFNPEAFLASERDARDAERFAEFGTLTFTPERLQQILARLEPGLSIAFKVEPRHRRIGAVTTVLVPEVSKELESLGLVADPKLVHLISMSILFSAEIRVRLGQTSNKAQEPTT